MDEIASPPYSAPEMPLEPGELMITNTTTAALHADSTFTDNPRVRPAVEALDHCGGGALLGRMAAKRS